MKNTLLILSILFFITGCSEKELNEKCTNVISDLNQFNYSQSDSFELVGLNFENKCLKVKIRYGGGCKEVSAKLIDSGNVFESNPVQRNLKIVFTDNDECEALIEKNFYFNLDNLQVENEKKILLNFQGSNLTYLYEY